MVKEEGLAKYATYANRIIIADAGPLINLNGINKLDYLQKLFSEVYTSETVKNECHFELPHWIKIEEPQPAIKNMLTRRGLDPGEKSAIALALEKSIMEKYNIVGNRPCLILDDRKARKIYERWNLDIDNIGTVDILSFAYEKKFFNREEGHKMIEQIAKNTRYRIKQKDIAKIFNETHKAIEPTGVER